MPAPGSGAQATSATAGCVSPLARAELWLPSTKARIHATSGGAPSTATMAPVSSATTAAQVAPTVRAACAHNAAMASVVVDAPTNTAAVSSASRRGSWRASADGRISSTSTPSTCWTSSMSRSTSPSVGSSTTSSSMAATGAPLEDVDTDHVTADGADPAGDGPEHARTVRKPKSQDVGHRHGQHGTGPA